MYVCVRIHWPHDIQVFIKFNRPRIAKTSIKEDKVEGFTLPIIRAYYKAAGIKCATDTIIEKQIKGGVKRLGKKPMYMVIWFMTKVPL